MLTSTICVVCGLIIQERRIVNRTAENGSGACVWPTKGTADSAPGKGHVLELTASRPSRHNAARSPATGRRNLEVKEILTLAQKNKCLHKPRCYL